MIRVDWMGLLDLARSIVVAITESIDGRMPYFFVGFKTVPSRNTEDRCFVRPSPDFLPPPPRLLLYRARFFESLSRTLVAHQGLKSNIYAVSENAKFLYPIILFWTVCVMGPRHLHARSYADVSLLPPLAIFRSK